MKDRIKELRRVKASELRANPDNWRLHPEHQRGALSALMGTVGVVAAVIARETEHGLELIDGHLRADIMGDEDVPVLIVDLNDVEARQVLATFDPIGELAKIDQTALNLLVPDLGSLADNGDIRLMMDQLSREMADKEEAGAAPDHYVAGMELEPLEHYDYILVSCRTTNEWNVLCSKLGLEPSKRRNRIGAARGITADRLLSLFGDA